jgi:UDPglucose 6-dehydrogenase
MKSLVVGVVGVGVVGGAVAECFEKKFKVIRHDINGKYRELAEVSAYASLVFVCVPTLNRDNGAQDLGPLENVLSRLEAMKYAGVVCVKCTVLPGTMDVMQARFPLLDLGHNPEFLTEANPVQDFMDQEVVLVSAKRVDSLELITMAYRELLPKCETMGYSQMHVTEMAKYIHNTFLATKVAFMNEVYDYCQDNRLNYGASVAAAAMQGRIGTSHLKVPGPDGKRGFGGMCFPKDTKALVWSDKVSRLTILERAVASNAKIRGQ